MINVGKVRDAAVEFAARGLSKACECFGWQNLMDMASLSK